MISCIWHIACHFSHKSEHLTSKSFAGQRFTFVNCSHPEIHLRLSTLIRIGLTDLAETHVVAYGNDN